MTFCQPRWPSRIGFGKQAKEQVRSLPFPTSLSTQFPPGPTLWKFRSRDWKSKQLSPLCSFVLTILILLEIVWFYLTQENRRSVKSKCRKQFKKKTAKLWFWRCSEQASPKCATLACGLFWAEGNQDPADSRTFISCLTTQNNINRGLVQKESYYQR